MAKNLDLRYDLQLFAEEDGEQEVGTLDAGSEDNKNGGDNEKQRIAELEKQLEERDKKYDKLKSTMDVKLKELGDMTKRERERMTAEEREKQEIEEIKKQNQQLLKEREIVNAERRFIQSGCDAELANEGAIALIEHDHDALFNVIGKMLDNRVATEKSELLKAIPKPQGGSSSNAMTKEQFNKLGYKARVELAEKDPELYNRLSQS